MTPQMPRSVARLILGLAPRHTMQDVTTAFKRLASTVHPDVCHGPEADRLIKLALNARNAIVPSKPPYVASVKRQADDTWILKFRTWIRPMAGDVVAYVKDPALEFAREFTLVEVIASTRNGWWKCRATLNPR